MQIDARKDHIVIVAPLEGGPSEKLGLKAGDVVMEIEGESTYEMTTGAASKLMRGKAGTSINIKIEREGVPDLMEYDIERAVITLHSVNYSGKIPGTDIGYLRLSTFARGMFHQIVIRLTLHQHRIAVQILEHTANPGVD